MYEKIAESWPKSVTVPPIEKDEEPITFKTKMIGGGDAKNAAIAHGHVGQSSNTPSMHCDWNAQHPTRLCAPRSEDAAEVGVFIRTAYYDGIIEHDKVVAQRKQANADAFEDVKEGVATEYPNVASITEAKMKKLVCIV